MYKTFTTRSLSALAIGTLLAGCSGGTAGPPVSQPREVADFHAIELRGAADLTIAVGTATSMTVTSDQATLDNLKTEVRDGRLVIEHQRSWPWFGSGGGNLKVTLATPSLDDLEVNGAGDVSITGIRGAQLALELRGAGDITASGETAQLDASINGAGDMNLSQLIARDAKVSVNGTGNLKVHATGALDATVNGVGSISYSGNPQPVKTAINGVGSIKPATVP